MASTAAAAAPLTLLRLWLDCRCLALEWRGRPPDAAAVWASLLQAPSRDAADALQLTLGPQRACRLLAVGETDCYAWEVLLEHCACSSMAGCWHAGSSGQASSRGLRRPAVDAAGRIVWEAAMPRCAATRRWLAHGQMP